jgi:hypothetical protein
MQSTAGIPTGFATAMVEQSSVDTCYEVINGGAVSYSPSVMLVRGRELIAEYQPDFVVVYVDETDLMDESVRYKMTTLRGPDGSIERVVPNVVDLMTIYERPVLVQQPSYILRLLEQIYYQKVLTPRLTAAVYGNDEPHASYERIMGPRLLGDAHGDLSGELAYFKASFREMLATFARLVGRDRILIARHPHFLHLVDAGRTPRYDDSLSKLLAEETAAAQVLYYDAGKNLKAIYGGDAAAYMNWPADPFSHLTAAGYGKFGRALGQYAAPRINAPLSTADQ